MKAISGKNLTRILENKGWHLKRVNGSHYIYTKSGTDARISVPVHQNQSLKSGLQKHIMKIANIMMMNYKSLKKSLYSRLILGLAY